MVKDAEAHAEEDRRFHELIGARNQADGMIHATRKSMEQLGDKMEADEKSSIEASIKELEEAMKGEDKERIDSLAKALGEVSGKMAEQRLYAQNQGGEGGPGGGAAGPGAGPEAGHGGAGGGKDDVVDAEFEEVKDGHK